MFCSFMYLLFFLNFGLDNILVFVLVFLLLRAASHLSDPSHRPSSFSPFPLPDSSASLNLHASLHFRVHVLIVTTTHLDILKL